MSKKILFAASECAPFVKTGGLADVAAALPVQLREMGADIRVVLPLYAKIKAQFGMHMRHECDFNIKLGWRNQYCGVESLVQRGITYYFIDNEYYFGRDYIYGVFNCDEAERFGFFSKAIIEMLRIEKIRAHGFVEKIHIVLKIARHGVKPRNVAIVTVAVELKF